MMGAKHTPGPWMFDVPAGLLFTEANIHPDNQVILDVSSKIWPDEDDARLIAAAPDLLAALERLVEAAPRGRDPKERGIALLLARAAIRKATGEAR